MPRQETLENPDFTRFHQIPTMLALLAFPQTVKKKRAGRFAHDFRTGPRRT